MASKNDVTNLISIQGMFVNPIHKKQMMGMCNGGFNFFTDQTTPRKINQNGLRAKLKPCKREDLEIGDFFRFTYSNHFKKYDMMKDKGIQLLTKIKDNEFYFLGFDSIHIIKRGSVLARNNMLYEKVEFEKKD